MEDTRVIRKSLSVLSVLLSVHLTGCATNLSEEAVLEKQYAAVERKEMIREFVNACEASGNVVIYTGPSTHKLRDPIKRIPNHAKRSEYYCTTSSEVARMQF